MRTTIFLLLTSCCVANSQTTPHELRVPDAPENIRVRTTSTSATLWWDPPSDPDVLVRGYTVEYGIAAPNRRIIIEGANTNSFTINRLEPNSTYVFSVSAYNEADGEDGQKVLLSGTTQADGGDPGDALWPPIAVRAQAYENGNVEVTWEDSNPHGREHNMVHPTHMRHYIVQYGIYQSENLQKVRSNSKHAKLTGLLPGKEYEIAVKVVEMNGKESPWSIRDIVLTPTDRTKAISRYDWVCEFEKDMCGMSNGDGKQWIRTRDKGSSVLTVDPMISKYRFATLLTPSFNMQTSNSLCLQFSYYAKQNKQGQLYVEVRDEKTSAKKELLRLSAYDIPEEDWQTITIPIRRQKHTFKIFFEVSWKSDGSWLSLDNIHVSSGACPTHQNAVPSIDSETEIDLLVPVESSLNSDPRVFRAKGIDNLPAIGIQRGAEIAVPYRLYLPRKFFRRFSILLAVKPMDRRGGYLFSVVNPYDTAVDVGLLLEPAENDQTNISLIYGADDASSTTRAVASFMVPQFVQQWTQIALEVDEHTVTLYYKCVRFAAKRIHTLPQLSMDDAHKLYIGSAGPILSSGFEAVLLAYTGLNILQPASSD